jgi:DNA-binding response OmpR family regulator
MNKLRPTEQAIYDTLSDGRLHKREDLLLCLIDPLADKNHLKVHICNLRKKLPPGLLIDCVSLGHKGMFYRLCRHINGGDGD